MLYKTCVRAFALSNELCTIQTLKGPKNLSALWNSGVSRISGVIMYGC